ncbi:MAG: hypothetical protein WBD95_11950 [Xanthobacteraceae bacterium]
MTGYLAPRDVPIWLAAKLWLDVRSNDEHTLISYGIALAMLERFVLPSILTDIGKAAATALLAEQSAMAWLGELMQLSGSSR